MSILFFDACVSFNTTFGGGQPAKLPDIDPWVQLQPALREPRNWTAMLPAGTAGVVSFAPQAQTGPFDGPLLDPLGAATVRQSIVPLNRRITRFGPAKPPNDPGIYKVVGVTVGGKSAVQTPVQDFFAPAQFKEMTDAQKLSAPSFEKMDSGFAVEAGGGLATGTMVSQPVRFDTIILEAGVENPVAVFVVTERHLTGMVARGAAGVGGVLATGADQFVVPGAAQLVSQGDEAFVIAGVHDLVPMAGAPTTRTEAMLALEDHLAEHLEDRGRLQVVPTYELAA